MNPKLKMLVVLLVVPFIALSLAGCGEKGGPSGPTAFDSSKYTATTIDNLTFEDEYANEQTETDFTYDFDGGTGNLPKKISAELTWTDEPDYQRGFRTWENEPDEFQLKINFSSGNLSAESAVITNSKGGSGMIKLEVDVSHEMSDSMEGVGTWTITVVCGDCADKYCTAPALLLYSDSGNAFDLKVDIEAYVQLTE